MTPADRVRKYTPEVNLRTGNEHDVVSGLPDPRPPTPPSALKDSTDGGLAP